MMNRHLGTVVVMPMTSGGRAARFRTASEFAGRRGFLLGDQVRSISKLRLGKMLDHADPATLGRALGVLRAMFEDEDDA
jgi:mRNA interferase MazF